LESANVDIAGEFVDLIILQRGYGANSRVISTANEIIKDTIALVR
jgi:flagellar hook protein FlgE